VRPDELRANDEDQSPNLVACRRCFAVTSPAARDRLRARGPGGTQGTSPACSPELAAMSYRLRSRETAAGRINLSPVSVRKLP
jgi:hypothetical protein